jgi:hypothetical protein
VQPREYWLRQFFVLDLLSFGFSMPLVLFVVASSMPRRIDSKAAKFAGVIWLSFVTASTLMAAAVGCGMGALVAGMLAVHPAQYMTDVYVPFYVTLVLMLCAFWGLMVRWVTIYPGWTAVSSGVVYFAERSGLLWLVQMLWAAVWFCLWPLCHQVTAARAVLQQVRQQAQQQQQQQPDQAGQVQVVVHQQQQQQQP